jgi:hypothetical protein
MCKSRVNGGPVFACETAFHQSRGHVLLAPYLYRALQLNFQVAMSRAAPSLRETATLDIMIILKVLLKVVSHETATAWLPTLFAPVSFKLFMDENGAAAEESYDIYHLHKRDDSNY